MIFCKNCGAQLEDSVTFCTQCGVRLSNPAPAPAPEAASVSEPAPPVLTTEAEAVPASEPVSAAEEIPVPETPPVPEFVESHSAPPMSETVLPPPVGFTAEKPIKEKTFFGVGALVFCLIIIGALSIATGVFAGLYFSAIA